MGLLQPLPIAEGHSQRIAIDIITDRPISGNSCNWLVPFVDHMTKRVHWGVCKKTINALAFACKFIDNILWLHVVP
jgi:hypothetical protein